jgi:6-pyruvoyltetrahydropterin/6-carboxytetrahydropterin synthase
MYEISQRFFFEAAHTLERQIEAEASRRIHGHTYDAEVAIQGDPDPSTGMVIDLGQLRRAIGELRESLDHMFLDEVAGLGVPTLENLCAFIARSLKERGFEVSRVTVWRERAGDRCEFRPA